ncbi:hypothetical protein GCM10007362_28000 [Saccharibacillus endophyticus]|uniref:Uncharacterized protein n=1 Tax=Saccharibacillus endophyticus TaxID=2060666 RepID=A0ABQ1ZYU4_9BACL|nr:hypothetical protein GCM10007362_28000 [Saccharibacillus endophyticus]
MLPFLPKTQSELMGEGRNSVKDAFELEKPQAFQARQRPERISPAAP